MSRRKSFGINSNDIAAAAAAAVASSVDAAWPMSGSGGDGEGVTAAARSNRNVGVSGYYSDGDVSGLQRASSREQVTRSLSRMAFKEMQESERYSIWHPRYRVPKPIFGFSKPFVHRSEPEIKVKAPLFDETVRRIRDGFEKIPTRGTFSRASKGLTAEWYPMDYTDLEAIRRQGYFHETIGDTQRYSHRDFRSQSQAQREKGHNRVGGHSTGDLSQVIGNTGSISLSPTRPHRRASIGQHVSRQYRSAEGRMETDAPEDFSAHRKWHPELASVGFKQNRLNRSGSNSPSSSNGVGGENSGPTANSLDNADDSQDRYREGARDYPHNNNSVPENWQQPTAQRHTATTTPASSSSLSSSAPMASAFSGNVWTSSSAASTGYGSDSSANRRVGTGSVVADDPASREERELAAYLSWLEQQQNGSGNSAYGAGARDNYY